MICGNRGGKSQWNPCKFESFDFGCMDLRIMAKQVEQIYNALKTGQEVMCEEADYRDYIENEKTYLTSDKYQKDALYWNTKYMQQPEKTIMKTGIRQNHAIEASRYIKQLPVKLDHAIKSV